MSSTPTTNQDVAYPYKKTAPSLIRKYNERLEDPAKEKDGDDDKDDAAESSATSWTPITAAESGYIWTTNGLNEGRRSPKSPLLAQHGMAELPSPTVSLSEDQSQYQSSPSPPYGTASTSPPAAPPRRSRPQSLAQPIRHRSYNKSQSLPEDGRRKSDDANLTKDTTDTRPTGIGATTITAPANMDMNLGTGGETNTGMGKGVDTSMGIVVNEEIIIAAEGWRRHTRVYGGGVCQACLESEQAMAQGGEPPLRLLGEEAQTQTPDSVNV